MTNPNNAVGTNGAFGGRTSVNAFNDIMGAFQSRGVLSGWGISPSSGMTVSVGGNGTTRDVAVAEDASGNKTSVNNISGTPINVTLDSAPASNSRYDAIVAYVDKPPMGNATQDNPECCGIIPVTGTAASSPSYPSDNTIRSAITADGASGATAYYAILGYVLVASGTTSITSGMITGVGNPFINGTVGTSQIQNGAVTTGKIANNAVTSDKIDLTTYTVQGTAVFGAGLTTPCTIRVVKLGGNLAMAVGSAAGLIVSSATQQFRITTATPLFSTIYGYSVDGRQSQQTGSYAGYVVAQTSTNFIDAYIRCPNTTSTLEIDLSYIVFGVLA